MGLFPIFIVLHALASWGVFFLASVGAHLLNQCMFSTGWPTRYDLIMSLLVIFFVKDKSAV